jgi:hypothetical protein
MKITDVTITLFGWESIPSTIYGHHTARPTGKSDLGLLASRPMTASPATHFSVPRRTRRASMGRGWSAF